MELKLIYALRKQKGKFWIQVAYNGTIKERSYPFQPYPKMVISWIKEVFEIPKETKIELIPATKEN